MENDPNFIEVETWGGEKNTKIDPKNVFRKGDELTTIFGGAVVKIKESDIINPKADAILESEDIKKMSVPEIDNLIGRLKQLRETL